MYTHRCVALSVAVCNGYPTCVARAHRADNNGMCQCLVLVDTDVAPTSYEAWTNPPDTTGSVKQLAASGGLIVLQVTNRRLEELPDELQMCSERRHIYGRVHTAVGPVVTVASGPVVMVATDSDLCGVWRGRSLIYTGKTTLPGWTKSLTKLEFLYARARFIDMIRASRD